ncbi:MAG: AAA family ATPase [Gemmatimonadaceae bacterium]|nr:AAA family ATPase [Gemmatimonadaceae bacterium]
MLALAPYLPPAARRLLGDAPIRPLVHWPEHGALLVADLVGFTALADQEAERGPAGAERLQQILDRVFAMIVNAILDAGGEVVKYAGDATLAWWPVTSPDALPDAVRRATATALTLQSRLPQVGRALDVPLALRVRVSAGPSWVVVAGGMHDRWELVQGGAPFADGASVAVPAGSIYVAPSAWPLIADGATGTPLAGGALVSALRVHAKERPGAPRDVDTGAFRGFVPQHVAEHLATLSGEWLAERRQVTTVFLTIDPLQGHPITEEALTAWHQVLPVIQGAVFDAGGSLVQAMVDDRGRFVVVAAWGVPGSSFVDAAERAVSAAHALQAALARMGHDPSIGIATGRVFCGRRGAGPRLEYAMIGRTVNLAARLMHESGREIWCDAATATAAGTMTFASRGAHGLKGLGTVEVFVPQRRASREVEAIPRETIATGAHRAIGRSAELDALTRWATSDASSTTVPTTRLALVEGAPGIGKSHLRRSVVDVLLGHGVVTLEAHGDPLDQQTAYRPLRRALHHLLDLHPDDSASTRGAALRARIAAQPHHVDRLPLLNPVLGLALPETPVTEEMSGRARADGVVDVLNALLQQGRQAAVRTVLLIEDAHWLDAASWSLLVDLLSWEHALRVLLFTRPFDRAALSRRVQERLQAADCTLQLVPLGGDAATHLVAHHLGVREVPAALTRAIIERTEGHPLFMQQTIAGLLDAGVVQRRGTSVTFDAAALRTHALADTVHGAIVSRFDRLPGTEQLLLKVASVIGREFDEPLLTRIAPSEIPPTALPAYLRALATHGLVERVDDGQWRFAHAIMCDAAYELLPLPRRRSLHAAIAAVLDATRGEDPAQWGRLAWHWTEAHDPVRAPAALERAGAAALRAGAYEEARTLYTRLVTLAERGFGAGDGTPITTSSDTRADWWWKRGLAEYDLGALPESRQSLETALAIDGDPVPRAGAALGVRLGGEALRHLFSRGTSRVPEPKARRIATVLNTLGRIYHLSQLPNETLYSILRRHNVMHGRPPSAELMTALSGMVYLNTLLGRDAVAQALDERLRRTHDQVGEDLEYADALYPITVSHLGQGRFDACARDVATAHHIFVRLGERKGTMAILAVDAHLAELRGDFARSGERYRTVLDLAQRAGDQVSELWALGGQAMIAYRIGPLADARHWGTAALDLATRVEESVSILSMDGLLAMTALRDEDDARARELLRDALPRLARTPRFQTAHHTLNGFDMLAEATLTLWAIDAARDPARARQTWERHASLAVQRLTAYARTFPIGRTIAATWRGTLAARRGDARGAARAWREGLAHVETLPIPFNAARLHAEIAAHPDCFDAPTAPHLEQALAGFRALGATFEVERVSRLAAPPVAPEAPSAPARSA